MPMNSTEERYPMLSIRFEGLGLPDDAHAALIRERRELSQEDFSKANSRFFSWELAEEIRLEKAYDEHMLIMAETRGRGYEYFDQYFE